jgi:hypothetical protein
MLSDQVLKIDIDSNDIDNHFHGDPIYEMVAKRHNLKTSQLYMLRNNI